ncbi:Spx/MgsR family RNA polymerase-binding regulatory protein [Hahella sp. SMD15-11]|uniref:Spx/MgsR family RNA polymerase-binding regulatory protein n=1 Tax=Thermohahella caldifontis TaxID=3142973 RepID=A0AB39V0E5_9GAMM
MLTVYGIRNCDTVRKAIRWLDAHQVAWQFHDVRQDGLEEALVRQWLEHKAPADLINTRSATWRQIPEAERRFSTHDEAVRLIIRYPTLLKRPVMTDGDTIQVVGFDADAYSHRFLTHS